MTIIIVIILIIGLFIFIIANSGEKKVTVKEPYANHKYDLQLQKEAEQKKSQNIANPIVNNTFQNNSEYEIVGIHVENRKKYITANCSEYDEVFLKHEKNNQYSNRAIQIKHLNKIIGYIPEYEVEEVHEILKNEYEAKISEIDFFNGFLTVKINIEY
ncbi:hypothetical protein [Flavobacterium degerlachei]|uniref:HIRAN domain-containing protein n=1 Tax=Flavobacterium degerlachei TaxID=229203 RepID=A0A1H2UHY3_9FLAO|nr:hypothetical protein [Flavobacterium degerlachei]SDW55169.1 hypothetical protein SAMN05444338_103164 [Flavobacterium degerlachei]